MGTLRISDTATLSDHVLIEDFYPSPEQSQTVCRTMFETIFKKDHDIYKIEGMFQTSINRHILIGIKIAEHPLIVNNLVSYCKANNVEEIQLKLHYRNRHLGSYYKKRLAEQNFCASISFHNERVFWINSLSTNSFAPFKTIKSFLVIVGQTCFLLMNKINSNFSIDRNKPILIWSSFANNREQIDYAILDEFERDATFQVLHPNPYRFTSTKSWNKSIYRLGKLSIGPWRYFLAMIRLMPFRKKLNKYLECFTEILGPLPTQWNESDLQKLYMFLSYNLLMNEFMKRLCENVPNTTLNVFRGGAAAGLIYSGVAKEKMAKSNLYNFLVTHGTEYSPIDHFSYFYLDYNILPSNLIVQNWISILQNKYSSILKYNNCKLIAGGRIDYEYLEKKVNPRLHINSQIMRVGIALTYNSLASQHRFIKSIVDSFSEEFGSSSIGFVIKPRPNVTFTLSDELKKDERIMVTQSNIFNFLNEIDLVVGTVSSYGVLTMVVSDAVYCDIPAFYFFKENKFKSDEFGYSFHPSMEDFCFYNEADLTSFFKKFPTKENLLLELKRRNFPLKKVLKFEGQPFAFLKSRLIELSSGGMK